MSTISGRGTVFVIFLCDEGLIRHFAKYSSSSIVCVLVSPFWGSGSMLEKKEITYNKSLEVHPTGRWYCWWGRSRCRYCPCTPGSPPSGPLWSAGTWRSFSSPWRCWCRRDCCSRSPRSGRSSRRERLLRSWWRSSLRPPHSQQRQCCDVDMKVPDIYRQLIGQVPYEVWTRQLRACLGLSLLFIIFIIIKYLSNSISPGLGSSSFS